LEYARFGRPISVFTHTGYAA